MENEEGEFSVRVAVWCLSMYLSIYLSIVLIPSWAIPESIFIAGHH